SSSPARSSASGSASWLRASGQPLVKCVRFLLHVPGAVGEPHELESVALVEPAGGLVLLGDPELEPLRPEALRAVEHRRPESAALERGIDVDVAEFVAVQAEEADDLVLLGDPDLVPIDEPAAEERAMLVDDSRQVRHLVPRAYEDAAHCRCICGSRTS